MLPQANRDLAETALDLSARFEFDDGLPVLDALLSEWQWPLPGRLRRAGQVAALPTAASTTARAQPASELDTLF